MDSVKLLKVWVWLRTKSCNEVSDFLNKSYTITNNQGSDTCASYVFYDVQGLGICRCDKKILNGYVKCDTEAKVNCEFTNILCIISNKPKKKWQDFFEPRVNRSGGRVPSPSTLSLSIRVPILQIYKQQ